MSRWSTDYQSAIVLTSTAMEEAARVGAAEAGVDHLLLALTLDAGSSGRALRRLGVDLDTARKAVDAQHEEQLRSLGVQVPPQPPRPITLGCARDLTLGKDVEAIIDRAWKRADTAGSASALLRALAAEPSGLVAAVLGRLGTSPEELVAALDSEVTEPPTTAREVPVQSGYDDGDRAAAAFTTTTTTFVPAAPTAVWDLLSTPSRMPQWEPSTGAVHGAPERCEPGATWTTTAPRRDADDRPLRVRNAYRVCRVEVLSAQDSTAIELAMSWPDAPLSNTRHLRAALTPAQEGTRLHLTESWYRAERRRGHAPVRHLLLGLILRPWHRFAARMRLMTLGQGIGRVFR